ncbi:MAG: hypothetical protein V3W14_13805 [Candidatus Neomarinimicrobiota bacterium]
MDQYVLVKCKLRLQPHLYDDTGERASEQHLILHRLRPLVGVAFDPDGYNLEGITGASVQVSGDSSVMIFQDMGLGRYYWTGDSQMVFPGGSYRLDIVLPDGHQIYSEIVAPDLIRWEGADTIWVEPDSISAWHTGPWTHYPIEFSGPGYSHKIRYDTTPGSELDFYGAGGGYFDIIDGNDLWLDFAMNDSVIQVFTAAESPSVYSADFMPVNLVLTSRILHQGEFNLDFALHDDGWPIENLSEISNVTGAYGFFTTTWLYFNDTSVVALRRDR